MFPTTEAMVTVEEYLHASFEYDAEYVDGRVIERPTPQTPHSLMQGFLSFVLFSNQLSLTVLPEQRIRTRTNRFRVADLCLTHGVPSEGVLTKPPCLCIEILSPDDTVKALRTKVAEYLGFGVEYVWIVDPEDYTGEIHTRAGIQAVVDGVFRAGEIEVDVSSDPRRQRQSS